MIIDTNKDRGRAGISLAIAYFGSNGYTVSIPLNDTQWYDLLVEKNGVIETVQCKFTASKDLNISLVSCGGTAGGVYDYIGDHPVDLLFCADKDANLFVIPVKDIISQGNKKTVALRTEPNQNNQGMNTFKYLVEI